MKKILLACCLAVIGIFVVSGCGGNSQPLAPTATFTYLPSTSTHTAVPTLTSTYTPTNTLTPTISLTPTITLTPTPRRTLLPTLSTADEIDDYLIDLLETNGGCEIPCFIGIEVGASTWTDVRYIFLPIDVVRTIRVDDQLYRYGFSHHFHERNHLPSFFFTVLGGNTVRSLGVSFRLEPQYDRYDYLRAVKKTFSLLNILKTNGVPSDIYLGAPAQGEAGAGVVERLYLIFEDLNFMIYYILPLDSNQANRLEFDEICFYEEWWKEITMHVVSDRLDRPLNEMANLPEYIEARYVGELYKITSLEPEDFYDIVMAGEAEPCFKLLNP